MEYKKFTPEQLDRAKNADLIEFLRAYYGFELRNRHLVDNSSLCICYLTRLSGGTAYTVRYAESKKINVFNLADRQKTVSK